MKNIFLTIFFTFMLFSGYSQEFPSELWHDGELVLVTDEIISGKLKYDQINGIVQVDLGNKILTYSARSIFHFEIYDRTSESYREFYTLPYGLITSHKAPVIFEVLVEGNLTLLTREYIVTKNIQSSYTVGGYYKEVLAYDYFFLDRDGNISKYSMKKKDLYDVLYKRQNQVIEFMKANRLHHDNRNDLVRVIAFYNALI